MILLTYIRDGARCFRTYTERNEADEFAAWAAGHGATDIAITDRCTDHGAEATSYVEIGGGTYLHCPTCASEWTRSRLAAKARRLRQQDASMRAWSATIGRYGRL